MTVIPIVSSLSLPRIKKFKYNGNHNSLLRRSKGEINTHKAMKKDTSDQKVCDNLKTTENCSPM